MPEMKSQGGYNAEDLQFLQVVLAVFSVISEALLFVCCFLVEMLTLRLMMERQELCSSAFSLHNSNKLPLLEVTWHNIILTTLLSTNIWLRLQPTRADTRSCLNKQSIDILERCPRKRRKHCRRISEILVVLGHLAYHIVTLLLLDRDPQYNWKQQIKKDSRRRTWGSLSQGGQCTGDHTARLEGWPCSKDGPWCWSQSYVDTTTSKRVTRRHVMLYRFWN